jgi:hypothetical protein
VRHTSILIPPSTRLTAYPITFSAPLCSFQSHTNCRALHEYTLSEKKKAARGKGPGFDGELNNFQLGEGCKCFSCFVYYWPAAFLLLMWCLRSEHGKHPPLAMRLFFVFSFRELGPAATSTAAAATSGTIYLRRRVNCHSGTMLDLPHFHCNSVYVPWQSKRSQCVLSGLPSNSAVFPSSPPHVSVAGVMFIPVDPSTVPPISAV